MFKILRLAILVPLAFAAGWVVASQGAATACTEAGGTMRDSVCRGVQ